MKNILYHLLILSLSFSQGSFLNLTDNVTHQIKNQHNIKTIGDFKNHLHIRASTKQLRDMSDIIGEWTLKGSREFYKFKVSEYQQHLNESSLMGILNADGYLNAVTDNFTTELNYLIDFDLIFGNDDDGDSGDLTYCEPTEDSGGEGWYCCDCNCLDFNDVECTESEYESGDCDTSCDRTRDSHTINLYLYQFDSECDGWNGEWAITEDFDGDTLFSGIGPDSCDSFTELELVASDEEYFFHSWSDGGDSINDSEYSYILVTEEGDTVSTGSAGQSNGFYLDDEDDDSIQLIITNMNVMQFFMIMFSDFGNFNIDSIGIDNPVAIGLKLNEDATFEVIDGIVGLNGVFIEVNADSTMDNFGTFDTTSFQFSVNNTAFHDSLGNEILEVSGQIGPEVWEFLPGQEYTVYEPLFISDDIENTSYVTFYDDSTGYDLTQQGIGDSAYTDTTLLNWYATSDSLFVEFYPDDSDYGLTYNLDLSYLVSNDTLYMHQTYFSCDSFPTNEDCIDYLSEDSDFILRDLTSVSEFQEGNILIWTSGHLVGIQPSDLPLATQFSLYSNYPNPFNPITTIRFDVGNHINQNTIVNVYDINGRIVAKLLDKVVNPGTYELQWDAKNLSSGIYFTEVIHGQVRQTQKMILLK